MAAADFVHGHPVLRPLLAPARRLRAYGRALAAPTSGVRLAGARVLLHAHTLPSRPARSRRRAALEPRVGRAPRSTAGAASRFRGRAARNIRAPAPSHVTIEPVRDSVDAAGALVCFLGPTAQPLDTRWLAHLTAAIHGDVVAATPLLVRSEHGPVVGTAQDLLVAAFGYTIALEDDAPVVRAHAAGRVAGRADPDRDR